MTLALAETGARVVAVETDRHLVPGPAQRGRGAGVEMVQGDALELDLAALLAERSPGPWSLVANLPYNVATPLVIRTLVEVPAVGPPARHGAAGGGRADGGRGRGGPPTGRSRCASPISPGPRSWAGSRPSVFIPRPRVESVLVRLERRPEPAVDPALVSYDRLNAVVRAGFAQRRKMLRRSLAGVVDPEAFERAGVRPDARAEELDVAAWGRLAAL